MSAPIETKLNVFSSFVEARTAARVHEIAPAIAGLIKFGNVDVGDIALATFLRVALVEGAPIGANLNNHQRILRIPGRLQLDYHVKRGEGEGAAVDFLERLSQSFSLQDLAVASRHSVKFKYANIVPIGARDRWYVVQSTIMYLRDVHQVD